MSAVRVSLVLCACTAFLYAQGGRLRVQPPEYAFGRVSQGSLVKARFYLINEGKVPIQIQEIKPSCSCSVLS
ncbi:MAG: DUF1573 domain-containing protein, partial [Bacteroidia bacterium]|nr:DUF1573 domain-containing protein [Bacteroidia bacterium]